MLLESRKQQLRNRLLREYGKKAETFDFRYDYGRMDRINIYHEEQSQIGNEGDVDDVTWNDLEMDDIFWKFNKTHSYIGEQVLYHKLHTTKTPEGLEKLEEYITYFDRNLEQRVNIEEGLCHIGKRRDDYFLPKFLMNSFCWEIGSLAVIRILQGLLVILGLGAVITQNKICIMALMAVLAINFVVYNAEKLKYSTLLYAFGGFKEFIDFGNKLIALKEEINIPQNIIDISKELKPLERKIKTWNSRKSLTLSNDVSALMWEYIMGVTLIDIITVRNILNGINGRQDQIMEMFEFVGEIDMAISIASSRVSLPYFTVPVIDEDRQIMVKDLVHPLIEDAISNDFVLENRALISGANASGKSTFMKALAINTILAQTIHTCTAKLIIMPRLQVITSLALRDDVTTGESYYMREAKRVRQMLEIDDSRSDIKSLILIDEILKGTNTIERIAASKGILNHFAKNSNFVVVATHDMELIDELNDKYATYYFESSVNDEDIVFEYKIKQGIGGKSNAIALLSLLGYPEDIIRTAKQNVM